MQKEVAWAYTERMAEGATPLGLVVALYDTILRDLRRANAAIAQKNIEKRSFEMNHALRVIAELENVLDFARGGKPAKQLKNFYAVTRGMILTAGMLNSREAVDQLIEIFGTMRQAWNEADRRTNQTINVAQVESKPAKPATPLQGNRLGSQGEAEGPRGRWSA